MDFKLCRATTKFRYGITDPRQLHDWLTQEKRVGVSFIGRSNVGKSSTINALFGNKTAQTSKTPGRTRQINIFEFKLELDGKPVDEHPSFYLFDLPGYGHAKVSKEMKKDWNELMGTFFQNAGENVLMLNLQDARHPNQKSDQEFRTYLAPFGYETYMIFNKLDKLKKQKERAALKKLKPQLFKEADWVQQIHFISAEKGENLPMLERSIVDFLLLQAELQSSRDLEDSSED